MNAELGNLNLDSVALDVIVQQSECENAQSEVSIDTAARLGDGKRRVLGILGLFLVRSTRVCSRAFRIVRFEGSRGVVVVGLFVLLGS